MTPQQKRAHEVAVALKRLFPTKAVPSKTSKTSKAVALSRSGS